MINPVKLKNNSSASVRFIVIGVFIGVLFFVLQKINHRDGLADFRVYYDAARNWLNGETPYGKAFGISSGYYKYSPVALYPFSIFTWMPYPLAAGIYYFLVLAAILFFSVSILCLIKKEFSFPPSKNGWILALSSIFLADHLERELHLGNVNVFLLIAVVGLYQLTQRQSNFPAGLLYAAILLVKPHFAILTPLFAWNKKWNLLVFTLAGLAAGFLLPVFVSGWSNNILRHTEWITAMREHNLQLSSSPNTIFGLVNEYVLRWLGLKGGSFWVLILLFVTILAFTYFLIKNRTYPVRNRSFFIEYFVLVALIPNLTHTDTEHFMWSWPLITFIISSLFHINGKWRWIFILLMLLAFIPYTLNSPDIVGRKTMLLFDAGGVLGVANLLILFIAIRIFYIISPDATTN